MDIETVDSTGGYHLGKLMHVGSSPSGTKRDTDIAYPKIYFKAQTLPVDRMLDQPVSPEAKVVGRLSPRITRELKRVSSLRWNIEMEIEIEMDCYWIHVPYTT